MSEIPEGRKFIPADMTADDVMLMAKEELGLELNASNAGFCLTFMKHMSADEMTKAIDAPTDFISMLIERVGGMDSVVDDKKSEEVIPLLDALETVRKDPQEGIRQLQAAANTAGVREATKRILNRQPARRDSTLPGRNDPCHCGSGKKFKKCHGNQ